MALEQLIWFEQPHKRRAGTAPLQVESVSVDSVSSLSSSRVVIDGAVRPARITFEDGVITAIDSGGPAHHDLGDLVVMPGLVDSHVHVNDGLVSRYKKGASTPTENTQFVFQAGDLMFHSSDLQWLIVTGADNAKFKGTGAINGLGEYMFQIWAGDGSGSQAPDTFRIKIWTEDGDGVETVVYDNSTPQPIAGGNVVVHTNNK